ncbi:helicase RepA family protein [Paraburkholderia sediminicola]|uniref:helicase RepA family protein n=1 Tax=Paraburkholderia sediminicola TaxID=458836 RepID=UPI0038BC3F55
MNNVIELEDTPACSHFERRVSAYDKIANASMASDREEAKRNKAHQSFDEDDEEDDMPRPRDPQKAREALGVVMFEDMGSDFEAPEELIEGFLTKGAGSILYGDSNSGKTFLAIDIACAVARGEPWMDRRVEQGLVIYVASESPASVRSRVQAYAKHHKCKVPNLAIVEKPVNLWSSEDDARNLIAAIKSVEAQTGQKAALIIGDTLARMSAGANENSGEDMGLVVSRFDLIRAETGAHFLLIHHSGKDATKGARGHSCLRAAIDTEVEVRDTAEGKFATVTKQRDLAGKGNRIGFSLKVLEMGRNQWGSPATSCVVEQEDCVAPLGPIKKVKVNTKEVAILDFLQGENGNGEKGKTRREIVEHLAGTLAQSKVYELVSRLSAEGKIELKDGKLFPANPYQEGD